jgi:very-short-patch-repair endonuclease
MDAVLRRNIDQASANSIPLRLAVHDPALIQAARLDVEGTLIGMQRWSGTRNAARALALADPAAESPLESESRGALLELGVPTPQCGYPIEGADGRVYWVDMAWHDGRVVGECDGLVKYADPTVLYREKLRQEALERAGSRVVRWTTADIRRRPTQVAARVLEALTGTSG